MPVLSDYGLWITFALVASTILAFDFFVLARARERLTAKQALGIVGVYAVAALGFGGLIFLSRGNRSGMEYLTGYLLEQSLSFDNIFMWVLIFKNLSIPEERQESVLFWGILGAIVFRAAFIFGGAELLYLFDWMLYGFGVLVIVSGLRLLRPGKAQNVGNSRIMRFAKAYLPVTKSLRGRCFAIREDGKWQATPLLLALIVIELTDVLFALDSIPAIFAVTRDTLIIYSSNIFAVIGLRALYFALAGLMERLRFLRYGLAFLLVMIGTKVIVGKIVEIPVWVTFAATVAVIGITAAVSLASSGPASRSRPAGR
ncbi:MAG TPA: TerC/Alx family metal homeostasis membrane protein [Sphingomicrobium sp.]|nr:TerC/Alx family metal homeostasis membrane protein [Sphingomicrobium sp.]